MTAINFPSSPTLNDEYTFGNKTWTWNGTGWSLKKDNGSALIEIITNANGKISGVALGNNLNALTIGAGLTGTSYNGSAAVTIDHADTSSATTLTANGRTYVTGLTFDTYGHVTGYTTGTETVTDTNTTYTAGTGLALTGTVFSVDSTLKTQWDTAYTDRNKWDGGSTGLTAATGRTSLGATTVGSNLFTLTNPTAITFLRVNADNTVSALDAAAFRTAIGAGTSSTSGTVTSVSTGTGLTGGTITSTGTISLATAYGDSVNPYASKTTNYVLAAPNGSAGVPSFRALVAADIPTLNQNTTGSAATLTTARTLTIGSTGKTFDGSANVSWSLAEIGALPLAGGTVTGALDVTGNYINAGGQMTFVKDYTVATATSVAITTDGASSTALSAGYAYEVHLTTTGTGTNTGAKYIVYHTAASTWVAKLVSRQGSTSNHPSLAISGTTMVVSHAHGSTYTIRALVKRFSTGNAALVSPFYFGIEAALTHDGDTSTVAFGSNQITSTVATGTAPLVVASTTKVANLNVEQVDGYHADTANTASTIVVRDASKFIYTSDHVFSGSTSGTTTLKASAAAGTTTITMPATTGTMVTTGDTGTVTSTMIADSTIVNGDISASAAIAVSKLAASTISGVTLGNNLNTLTIGTGLSGTSYNGSSAVTIALANTAVTAGSYTNANITVDAQGRITSASSGTASIVNIDGGNASTVYTSNVIIDGGGA